MAHAMSVSCSTVLAGCLLYFTVVVLYSGLVYGQFGTGPSVLIREVSLFQE